MRRRMVENRAAAFGRADAERLRETFQDKPWEWETEFSWTWPKSLREVGVGMAVMYRSDKWKKKGKYESYKHICESPKPWKLFAVPGFTVEGVHLHGGSVPVAQHNMPSTIATLALFLGLQCRFYVPGHRGSPMLLEGDQGIYEVHIPKAKLAAGRTKSGDLFLCVYDDKEGPKLFLFGEELDVEKDGIVG